MVCQLLDGQRMREQPAFSIVIPAYNEQGRLEATLRSYLGYFRTRGEPVEVIVVDDGSLDATTPLVERLAAEFEELRLIRLAQKAGPLARLAGGVAAAARAAGCSTRERAAPIWRSRAAEAAVRHKCSWQWRLARLH